ncbi:unnamed protein product, partial [marine sediment metagenome]
MKGKERIKCVRCNGSGNGPARNGRCSRCNGSGKIWIPKERFYPTVHGEKVAKAMTHEDAVSYLRKRYKAEWAAGTAASRMM